jgi:hypothetical protein
MPATFIPHKRAEFAGMDIGLYAAATVPGSGVKVSQPV